MDRIGRTTTDFPPGTIIIPCSELGRWSSFTHCYRRLRVPKDTHELMKPGLNIARNLNNGLSEREGDWVWFMGDDHSFDEDILLRLLARMYGSDKNIDMLVPMVLQRMICAESLWYHDRQDGLGFDRIALEDLPTTGLVPIDNCGGAGLLVKMKVVDTVAGLDDPAFEFGRVGGVDGTGEDLWFVYKAKLLGFNLYGDTEIVMGHSTQCTLWPKAVDGKWKIMAQLNSGPPMITPPPKKEVLRTVPLT